MSLPHHLRAYKEDSKENATRTFFNINKADEDGLKGMEINCVLSIEGEAVHVSVPISSKRGREGRPTTSPAQHHSSPLGVTPVILTYQTSQLTVSYYLTAYQAGRLYLLPPFLCFLSLDRRSARFTIPLFCIRRVERLNSRAGVFALGVGLWHGLRVVSTR